MAAWIKHLFLSGWKFSMCCLKWKLFLAFCLKYLSLSFFNDVMAYSFSIWLFSIHWEIFCSCIDSVQHPLVTPQLVMLVSCQIHSLGFPLNLADVNLVVLLKQENVKVCIVFAHFLYFRFYQKDEVFPMNWHCLNITFQVTLDILSYRFQYTIPVMLVNWSACWAWFA